MDVWRITLAALRRWYVLLPLLALTGVLAVAMGNRVAPEYEGRAAAMLAPPRAQVEIANPYGSVTGANEALGIVLNSVETRTAIAAQGLPAGYEVGAAARSTILQLTTRAATPDEATAAAQAVLDLAAQELSTRQTDAGLSAPGQITLSILEPPAVTSVVETGAVRVQAVAVVIGGALSLLVAVLFDDIVGLWRRARTGSRRPPKAKPEAAVTETPSDNAATAPRAKRPRRKADVAEERIEPNGDDHGGLATAAPSVNAAMINTNEWMWPGDHGLDEAIEAEQRARAKRNPFFDPEFTKRQLAKTKSTTDADADADATTAARHP